MTPKKKIVPFNIAWYEALKDSAGPEVRLAVYEAVFEWIKSGERPDINKMTDVVGMALRFIMLDMDKES